MAKAKKIVINARKEREKSGMNQTEFWRMFGITQSCGSRYESGRNIPKPVKMLMAFILGYASLAALEDGTLVDRV